MNTYETSATVEGQGQVHLSGVPFAPGTEVEITISPKSAADPSLEQARERMRELFRTVKGFHGTPKIPREELHERGSLR